MSKRDAQQKTKCRKETSKQEFEQETKYLVFGFVKQFYKSHVPPLITNLCLSYYGSTQEYFSEYDKDMLIDNNNETVHFQGHPHDMDGKYYWATVYGNTVIDSMNTNTIYQWKFRIDYMFMLVIGIDNAKCKWMMHNIWDSTDRAFYAYHPSGRLRDWSNKKMHRVGQKFKKGDIVTMVLDLIHNQIRFLINNIEIDYKFTTIERSNDLKYRMAISGRVSDITLVDFSISRH